MIYELKDSEKGKAIFEGWQETMIYSCLQKVMGHIYVTDFENPKSAVAIVGCFAFYAGKTNRELALALELPLDQMQEMLVKAGFSLSHSNKFDIIIEFFVKRGNYNVYEINEALFAFDQSLIGA